MEITAIRLNILRRLDTEEDNFIFKQKYKSEVNDIEYELIGLVDINNKTVKCKELKKTLFKNLLKGETISLVGKKEDFPTSKIEYNGVKFTLKRETDNIEFYNITQKGKDIVDKYILLDKFSKNVLDKLINTGSRLSLVDDKEVKFINHQRGLRIDSNNKQVKVSKRIFDALLRNNLIKLNSTLRVNNKTHKVHIITDKALEYRLTYNKLKKEEYEYKD